MMCLYVLWCDDGTFRKVGKYVAQCRNDTKVIYSVLCEGIFYVEILMRKMVIKLKMT